jgi:hypothetical protein
MEYLAELKHLRDDFDGTIPDEILHNIGGTHKVSSGWYQKIFNALHRGMKEGIIDEEYTRRYQTYLTSKKFKDRLTTREDIQFADGLLTELIDKLKTTP